MALTPSQARRHPDEMSLWKMASGARDLEAEAHVNECRICQRRFTKYADVVSVLKAEAQDLAGPAERFEKELPVPARRALAKSRAGDALAAEIVACAKEDPEALPELLEEKASDGVEWAYALVYACHASAPLAGSSPKSALALAEEAGRHADRQISKEPPFDLFDRARAEADLLASQARLYLQETEAAIDLARSARARLKRVGFRPLDKARCDYFEASALGFAKRYEEALSLLRAALRGFRDAAQDHWVGRAEAAIGLVMTQRNNDPRALDFFDSALERLDPELDTGSYWWTALARGTLLEHLGRLADARDAYRAVLSASMRHGSEPLKIAVRVDLAELDLREARVAEAMESFLSLRSQGESLSYSDYALSIRLGLAECFGRLGRDVEMASTIEEVRSRRGEFEEVGEAAFEDLFGALDGGSLEVAVVSHVRSFLERRRKGSDEAYSRYVAA